MNEKVLHLCLYILPRLYPLLRLQLDALLLANVHIVFVATRQSLIFRETAERIFPSTFSSRRLTFVFPYTLGYRYFNNGRDKGIEETRVDPNICKYAFSDETPIFVCRHIIV